MISSLRDLIFANVRTGLCPTKHDQQSLYILSILSFEIVKTAFNSGYGYFSPIDFFELIVRSGGSPIYSSLSYNHWCGCCCFLQPRIRYFQFPFQFPTALIHISPTLIDAHGFCCLSICSHGGIVGSYDRAPRPLAGSCFPPTTQYAFHRYRTRRRVHIHGQGILFVLLRGF